VVICLERGADLHMAQLMPLSLTVSCFSKIQTGFTFLVPADQGSPGKMAVKRVCAYNDLHKSRLLEISVGAISTALSPPSRPSLFLSLPFPLPFLTLSLFCLCNFLSPRSLPVNPTRGSGELVTSFLVGSCLFMTVSLISVFKRLWRKKKGESSVHFSAVGLALAPSPPQSRRLWLHTA